jgi:hypothetical protein
MVISASYPRINSSIPVAEGQRILFHEIPATRTFSRFVPGSHAMQWRNCTTQLEKNPLEFSGARRQAIQRRFKRRRRLLLRFSKARSLEIRKYFKTRIRHSQPHHAVEKNSAITASRGHANFESRVGAAGHARLVTAFGTFKKIGPAHARANFYFPFIIVR